MRDQRVKRRMQARKATKTRLVIHACKLGARYVVLVGCVRLRSRPSSSIQASSYSVASASRRALHTHHTMYRLSGEFRVDVERSSQ